MISRRKAKNIKYGLLSIIAIYLISLVSVFSSNEIDPYTLPRTIVASIILIIVIGYIHFFRIHLPTVSRGLSFFIFLYLATLVLSISIAINIQEALYELSKNLIFIITIYLVAPIFLKWPKFLPSVISIVSTVLLFISGYQFLRIYSYTNPDLITGAFGNPNIQASALALTLPFLFIGLLKGNKYLYGTLIVLVVIHSLFIESKSVILSISVGCLVVVGLNIRLLKKKHFTLPLVVIFALTTFFLYKFQVFERATAFGKNHQITTANSSKSDERIYLWKKTEELIKENPLTGVGLGNWKVRFPETQMVGNSVNDGKLQFRRPHNDFIQITSELGVLGLLSWLGLLIFPIKRGLKGISNNTRLTFSLLIAGIVLYITDSFFSYPHEYLFHGTILGCSIGLLAGQRKARPMSTYKKIVGLLLLLGVLIFSIGRQIEAQDFKTLKDLYAHKEYKKTYQLPTNKNFISLDQFNSPQDYYSGNALLFTGQTDKAIKRYRAALLYNPNHVQSLINLSGCYLQLGDFKNAEKTVNRALNLYPRNRDAFRNLCICLIQLNQYEKAYDQIKLFRFNSNYQQFEKVIALIMNGRSQELEIKLPSRITEDQWVKILIVVKTQGLSLQEAITQFSLQYNHSPSNPTH